MTEIFDASAKYYDLFYQNKDYFAEVNYIDSLIRRFSKNSHTLLEFGSGTGKHATHLVDKGYQIHGVEKSKSMIELSPKKVGFISQLGDIKKINLQKEFDAVISLFHVFSYQTTNSDVLKLLNNAYRHLKIGGLFIFDIWYNKKMLG